MPVEQNLADLRVLGWVIVEMMIITVFVFFVIVPILRAIVGVVGHTINRMSQTPRKEE